ncbi:MAG: hypothetical protein IPO27_02025 [Bacteroidetes bacterium]|nr:hypothetical protein [Bacteroidota bacterium]
MLNTVDGVTAVTDGSVNYTNPNGDIYTINRLKYYLSNFELTTSSGSKVKLPDTYFLIDDGKESSKKLVINKIPVGDYTQMSYLIGVDSARNTTGAQTGALDPSNNMFWSWSTGYIFFKLEGTSPQASINGNNIAFHVGGFKNPYMNIVTVNLPLTATQLKISNGKTSIVTLQAEINEVFKTPNLIDFASQPFLTSAKDGVYISSNSQDMFSIQNIVNAQ